MGSGLGSGAGAEGGSGGNSSERLAGPSAGVSCSPDACGAEALGLTGSGAGFSTGDSLEDTDSFFSVSPVAESLSPATLKGKKGNLRAPSPMIWSMGSSTGLSDFGSSFGFVSSVLGVTVLSFGLELTLDATLEDFGVKSFNMLSKVSVDVAGVPMLTSGDTTFVVSLSADVESNGVPLMMSEASAGATVSLMGFVSKGAVTLGSPGLDAPGLVSVTGASPGFLISVFGADVWSLPSVFVWVEVEESFFTAESGFLSATIGLGEGFAAPDDVAGEGTGTGAFGGVVEDLDRSLPKFSA